MRPGAGRRPCEASHATRPELPLLTARPRRRPGSSSCSSSPTVTLARRARPAGRRSSAATGSPSRSCSRSSAIAHLLGADRDEAPGLAALARADLRGGPDPPALAHRRCVIAVAFIPEWIRTRSDWYIARLQRLQLRRPRAARPGGVRRRRRRLGAGWTLGAVARDRRVPRPPLRPAGRRAQARARRRALRDTVRLDCVLIDAGLLSLGAIGAALWADFPGPRRADAPAARARLPLARDPGARRGHPDRAEDRPLQPAHLNAALGQELGRAGRFDRPVALLMVDVDHLGRSTPPTATSPATARSSRSPRRSGRRRASTTSRRASAATSSASFCRRRTWRAP